MTRFLSRFIASIGGRRRFLAATAVLVLIWIALFDSHSLIRRLRWQHEVKHLRAENELLSNEIDQLRATVAAGLSRSDIVTIARTQYGMSRPGEMVHRVDDGD